MEIEVHRHEECDHCHGTGGEPGSRVDTCPNCHGSGQEAVIQNTPFGRMQSVRTCSRCHGTGKALKNLVLNAVVQVKCLQNARFQLKFQQV